MGWVVMKFGGTSVSSLENWNNIASAVRTRLADGERPLLVCSAFSGVSNMLDALLASAITGEHESALQALRAVHTEHAAALGLSPSLLDEPLDTLARLARGVHLVGEASPRLKARVMAQGELMSTRLGAAWLNVQGLETAWLDARSLLRSEPSPLESLARRTLSARCNDEFDAGIAALLASRSEPVLLTQGFIARDPDGHTVLLGRGGSDTSASYLAARVAAIRCEIWTDVPGMYTANPRQVQSARLLKALSYDEAQEIASTGARVLHPRCIPPVRRHQIPLHIRCTQEPATPHTIIGGDPPDLGARVKAVSTKKGVTLISMDTAGMWQQVGFLSDIFSVFKQHGLSVDLVSTSEMNVTVSLDPSSNVLDDAALATLLGDLSPLCEARMIGPCAAVSLVGQRIRTILHKLGPALKAFEEQRIHLVSQAASDLNLTLVVDEDQAERMVIKLHQLLFPSTGDETWLGPSWTARKTPSASTETGPRWWRKRSSELVALADQTPLYVYDAPSIEKSTRTLAGLQAIDRVFYAIKANAHPEILRLVEAAGLGFECVSPGEIDRVRETFPDLPPDRILFTPNFAPREEYAYALNMGVNVTLDNLHPITAWPEVFRDREVFVRVDPGQGRGHHHYVRTAGAQSKFGVWPDELPEVRSRLGAVGATVIGLHAHTGSGIREPGNWTDTALFLLGVAEELFPSVRILNLGGGLGVPERPGQPSLDLAAVDASLLELRRAHPRYALWMEPGRYVVANAGVLLARVTQVKQKGSVRYVGLNAGMNSLIRPALYGAWHGIVNLSRLDTPRTECANIVGPICESGDTLGYERQIAPAREGDVFLIDTAGAYGRAMSSAYNLRTPASEKLLR